MSHTISVQHAAAHLAELVRTLEPGDEIVLTQDDRPVARIVPGGPRRSRRTAGACKGMLAVRTEDEEHLDGFREYMP